jgi:DNA-binding response OmpR family regulator
MINKHGTNNLHILLADDDADDRAFFREALILAALHAELITVEDGKQLMDYLTTIDVPPPPDIIFLDINMPYKNGKACLREIRNNQKFNNVPVIMFSTSSHHKDIDDAYTNGANMYICKSDFFDDEVNMLNTLFSPNWKEQLANPSKDRFILKAS